MAGESALAAHWAELKSLRSENRLMREQLTVLPALQMMERFHAFDAIRNDACPACGGRVSVEETPRHVRLRAVGA